MYIGTGEESLLLKCLKPRARASRDALLPISAWRTFPSLVLPSSLPFRVQALGQSHTQCYLPHCPASGNK
uniref:Uncharacterized protein n=1 Tax=Ursus americanus TaxID=9643 RepID=A0A452RYQ7_URSAM